MRIYLSVPIIANRDLGKAKLAANTIRNLGHTLVSDWVVSPDPGFALTPDAVLNRDMKGVEDSNIIVAETSVPSHGVGMELMLGYLNRKKIVCLFRKGSPISRMIMGIPGAFLIEYDQDQHFVERLTETLTELSVDEDQ
jgi:2'-deoxynucleoside 5'-phosphate N-hydrolase